jgi:hypothetical protein
MNSRDVMILVFFQNFGKCLLIAGDQVVGTGFVGAFQKYVVVRVAAHVQAARRSDDMAVVLDELEQLQAKPLADAQLRA